ncbi:hypothetical protein [Lysobacter claricitrinus]|uniref:hypothetical protein n=1 Tax=Lysobacter claricitrinus TaxID=3367728 RepID=UPI0037DBBDAE
MNKFAAQLVALLVLIPTTFLGGFVGMFALAGAGNGVSMHMPGALSGFAAAAGFFGCLGAGAAVMWVLYWRIVSDRPLGAKAIFGAVIGLTAVVCGTVAVLAREPLVAWPIVGCSYFLWQLRSYKVAA